MDGGMQEGKREDMPAPLKVAKTKDKRVATFVALGEPDLVLKSPPLTIGARTQDKWFRPTTETGSDRSSVACAPWRDTSVDARRTQGRSSRPATLLEQREEGGLTGLASSAHDHQTTAGLFMEWSIGKVAKSFRPTRAS